MSVERRSPDERVKAQYEAGDFEIRRAMESEVLLHQGVAAAGAETGLSRALQSPPPARTGTAIGYYTPSQAYRDLLSWPTSVFRSLVERDTAPEPWSTALRPAHLMAVALTRTAMTPGDKMQVNAMREITDRVEGPVERKVSLQATVSHVLVVPGDPYPRPAIDVETLPEADED